MKYLFFVFLLGITATACKSVEDSQSSAVTVTSGNEAPILSQTRLEETPDSLLFVVDVELMDQTETLGLPPYCGILMTDMTLNYRVIKVVSGNYAESTIRINHTCPRELIEGKAVQNGKTYRYKLKPRTGFDLWIIDGEKKEVPLTDYQIVR